MSKTAHSRRGTGGWLYRLHRTLLPDHREIGWTPYLWLVYLGFFTIEWYFRPVPWWEALLSGIALVVFLALYFRGFWAPSRERLWLAVAIAGIGMAMTPFNQGGVVFFIYACASAGSLRPRRRALLAIAALIIGTAAYGAMIGLGPIYILIGSLIGGLVALANVYYTGKAEEDAALRLSQQEVQDLAATRERERIGRDLHDLLGQSLSLITIKVQLARRLMTADPERAASELADIETSARRTLEEVRQTVRGYRRSGLRAELAGARLALESSEIALDYALDEMDLPADMDAELALVLREAVTNVLRHARASRCRVRLEKEGDHVRFVFGDNGGGQARESGSGITGMRERIEGLGGQLTVHHAEGVELEARLPLAQNGSIESTKTEGTDA